jgi:glycosyltransferase involved in cell wall biosynthesis
MAGLPGFPAVSIRCIALLGRQDKPTDAVEEYCSYLGNALVTHDFRLEVSRVSWELHGWTAALRALELQAASWRDTWVLLQYTALAWSSRGFPHKALRVLKILRSAGARTAVVYHDVEPYPGSRLIDHLRRVVQLRTMRSAIGLSDLAIFTIPLNKVSWLPNSVPKAHFIPVGPNLPIPEASSVIHEPHRFLTIGVFSITGGAAGARETETIVSSVRYAAEHLGKIRLLIFGRHAELREVELRHGLKDSPVELSVEGVVQPNQVVHRLSACDVLLFVRGPISSRRGSALAGIACGLPVIAYPGFETAPPITDAGIVLVPPEQPEQLQAALLRILSDRGYREQLAAKSLAAYHAHFAWPTIAARWSLVLRLSPFSPVKGLRR